VQSRIVAADEAVGRSFVDAFEDTPVVLMSCGGSPDDVMRAVKLGAVDFMDKPLSHLKLKNIWQHSVRKVRWLGRRSALAPQPRASAAREPASAQAGGSMRPRRD
jgi:DNA-binding NtrC family response regulator